MKSKMAALLLLAAVLFASCSNAEKKDSEAAEQSIPAVTEAPSSESQTETAEPVTEPVLTKAETEPDIEFELTELDYYQLPDDEYDGETALFGDESFGFVELPSDWSESVYDEVQERYTVSYANSDKSSLVVLWNNLDEIDKTVKTYYQIHTKHDGTPDVFRCEINGYKAYRSSYINEDGKHIVEWDIERPRGIGWHMKFIGDEDISALADYAVQSVYKEYDHARGNGESLIIGEASYGYLEVAQDWEYEPPDAHRKPLLRYTDSEENRIIMINCERFGFQAGSVKELAEIYYDSYCSLFENTEMIESEVDGLEAYKISYNSADAIKAVNYGEDYKIKWIFVCADGNKRSIVFSGSEDIAEMSDSIMETYHLYLAD